MKRPAISVADLPPATRKKLGLKRPSKQRMSKDAIRGFALGMLATVDHLTQAERARVLVQAARLNAV